MSNMLRSIGFVVAMGYSALGCGPDTVNNYYGGQRETTSPSSPQKSGAFQTKYTCQDAEDVEFECIKIDQPFIEFINLAEHCKEEQYTAECIDCIVNAPCTPPHTEENGEKVGVVSPYAHCLYSGICN